MNHDEFAFFNQQLAAMLRQGVPLEGALKQLSGGMRDKAVQAEVRELEADLARGTPLREALGRRTLPPLFVRLVEAGAQTNDLPGVLTLLADHYHRTHALWTRLKGLLTYPCLVVLVSLGLTLALSFVFSGFMKNFFGRFPGESELAQGAFTVVSVWIPPIFLAILALLAAGALSIPQWRGVLRWRLPAFREASLAQLASAISLMLKNGTPLPEALVLAEAMESGTPAAPGLARWRALIEQGQGKPAQWSEPTRTFPPLFLWLVQQSGEDVAAGFQNAAQVYRDRASYRIELLLYGALPVSIVLLGQLILWQVSPLFRGMIWFMNMLGDMGGL